MTKYYFKKFEFHGNFDIMILYLWVSQGEKKYFIKYKYYKYWEFWVGHVEEEVREVKVEGGRKYIWGHLAAIMRTTEYCNSPPYKWERLRDYSNRNIDVHCPSHADFGGGSFKVIELSRLSWAKSAKV